MLRIYFNFLCLNLTILGQIRHFSIVHPSGWDALQYVLDVVFTAYWLTYLVKDITSYIKKRGEGC